MIRRTLPALALVCSLATADAMVGGAPPAGEAGRSVVLLVGSRGTSCTGVALARDVVLTAAHCVEPGADYRAVEFDAARQPTLVAVDRIARHPQYETSAAARHRATADVALLKLAQPLRIAPAQVARPRAVAVGDRITVVGAGLAAPGDGRSGGVARVATLVATGKPGSLQVRLVDPATKGERAGLGACTGDSGAPAFVVQDGGPAVIGVVSWSTGPKLGDGCGGLTGLTPLSRYRDWILRTAKSMAAPL